VDGRTRNSALRGDFFEAATGIYRNDFEYFDYIIGMDESNLADLYQMCPQDQQYKIQPFASESVPDPWYTGDFEETYDRISTGCRAWLSRLENESENGKYKETL